MHVCSLCTVPHINRVELWSRDNGSLGTTFNDVDARWQGVGKMMYVYPTHVETGETSVTTNACTLTTNDSKVTIGNITYSNTTQKYYFPITLKDTAVSGTSFQMTLTYTLDGETHSDIYTVTFTVGVLDFHFEYTKDGTAPTNEISNYDYGGHVNCLPVITSGATSDLAIDYGTTAGQEAYTFLTRYSFRTYQIDSNNAIDWYVKNRTSAIDVTPVNDCWGRLRSITNGYETLSTAMELGNDGNPDQFPAVKHRMYNIVVNDLQN